MFDPALGYDSSIDITTDSGLIDSLSWIGFSSLIRYTNLFKDAELSKVMFSKHTMEKYSEILSEQNNLSIICQKAHRNKINLYQHPVWTDFLDAQFEAGVSNNNTAYEAFRTQEHYINYYLEWKQDVNWMEIYNLYFTRQKNSSYLTQPFTNALSKYFSQNPLCARISVEADLFDADQKPDSNVRTEMYCAYIKAGFLDKKKARKIRSESSEYTSMKSIACLIEVAEDNPNLYPNIDEMLLQFSDTKHHSVQEVIASRAPFRLLYAFVGFESNHAKRTLEQRMQNGK